MTRPSLAWYALAPVAGVAAIVVPYGYWRLASSLFSNIEAACTFSILGATATVVTALVIEDWRGCK